MGQGPSTEQLTAQEGTLLGHAGIRKFSAGLPMGLSNEEKKARYEKEITRLLESYPEGGQDKYRAEYKGNEKIDLNEAMPSYKELSFNKEHMVYQVHKEGLTQRNFKKSMRSKNDPWRKHGPVRKLHEIGGKTFDGQAGARPQPSYFDIRAGTTPPPDPTTRPLTSIDDYRPFGGISGSSVE